MNKLLLLLIICLVLIGGIVIIVNKRTGAGPTVSNSVAAPTSAGITAAVSPSQQAVKVIDVTAANFSFDPKEISVAKGTKVRIVLHNSEGFHDWVIDEFKAHTKRIAAGQEDTVEFTADKTGQFEYYCSVANHRQMGMTGTLTVQ